MRRVNGALGVAILAGALAAACGGGEQNSGAGNASTPAPAPQASTASEAAAGNVEITLTTQPDPPKMGETTFEAMVMAGGQPVTDADVSVELFMPAMPSMNMAEMRNSIALKHEGSGRYRGAGNVMMVGNWDATVSVKRDGKEVGSRKTPITAK